MKIKTSVAIDEELLVKVKEIAKREDRSVSYILGRMIEAIVRESPAPPFMQATHRPHVSYSQNKKRR